MIITKNKYHIALDDVGMVLQGVPEQPVYRVEPAPIYTSRFAQGDRTYDDFSKWWYFVQTDWYQGIKNEQSWEDDGKFYASQNIDADSRTGSIRLQRDLSLEGDYGGDEIYSYNYGSVGGSFEQYFGGENGLYAPAGGTAIAGTPNDVVAWVPFKDYAWCSSIDSAAVNVYDGATTTTAMDTYINTAIGWNPNSSYALLPVGGTLYIAISDSFNDNYGIVSTTVGLPTAAGDFTVVLNRAAAERIIDMEFISGGILYLVVDSNGTYLDVYFYDISAASTVLIKRFQDVNNLNSREGASKFLVKTEDGIIVIVPIDAAGEIWLYTGSQFGRIYRADEEKATLYGEKQVGDFTKGGVAAIDGVIMPGITYRNGNFYNNFLDDNETDVNYYFLGVSANGQLLLVEEETPDEVLQTDSTENFRSSTGNNWLVMNQFDKVAGIEKLAYSTTIIFDKFDVAESIEIEYNIGDISDSGDWQDLGTASYTLDGADATEKTFYFPENTKFKKIWYRIKLDGDGSSSPVLKDIVTAYTPTPPQDKRWRLSVDCGDAINLINGERQDQNGREIRGFLDQAWLRGRILNFQDVDFAMCNLTSAVSAGDTTINVDDTSEFPERGRLRINDEIIFYTGKTQKTFTGCIRGQKDTKDAAHSVTTAGTGTISSSGSSVTGSGTAFTTELQVGDMITADAQQFQVIEITSATTLKIDGVPSSPWSADAFTISPSVNNAYKVIVESMGVRIPVLNKEKKLEYVASLVLREVI